MNRQVLVCIIILIAASLACAQPSPGALSDIACALQGLSNCNQPSGGGGGGGGVGDSGIATPTPLKVETLVPTPSPTAVPIDPLQVVYARNGNIWFWDETADSPRQLTYSGQDSTPKISDDGLVIAFRRQGELWAVDSSGENQRVIVSSAALSSSLPSNTPKPVEPRQFDFAPHSHDVYLNITVVGDLFSAFEYNLVRVNADSPSLQVLLDGSQGGGQFVFSPDGTKIALPRKDKINIVNPDGSNLETVFTFPVVLLHTDANYIPEIRWMPGGSGFTTVIPPEDAQADPGGRTRFYYIFTGGEQPAQLAEFITAPALQSRSYISPDGSKVLYAKPQGANLELHVIDASTTDQVYFSYPASNVGLLGWAPDSKQVMYWIDDKRRAWLTSPGTEPALLSDVGVAANVTWVDSRRYLFLNDSELRLRTFDEPSILIDGNVNESSFDFIINTIHTN